MRFDSGIGSKYVKSIEAAFDTIAEKGDEFHRRMIGDIRESDMLVRCGPVSKVNASGRTGLISSFRTNARMYFRRFSLEDALAQVYIVIAEETIDTGGQRGCEGTFVHEGRHAYDYAQMLTSLGDANEDPLGVFNPTVYELEWNAHHTAGDYMLCINKQEYLDEGKDLMILGQRPDGTYFVNDDGIRQRLRESYGLWEDGNQGPLASKLLGIRI